MTGRKPFQDGKTACNFPVKSKNLLAFGYMKLRLLNQELLPFHWHGKPGLIADLRHKVIAFKRNEPNGSKIYLSYKWEMV